MRRLEKLRAKHAFEASLPAVDDVARLPERQAMIEAWEVQEWMEREEEIKGVQEERLSLLTQALQVRNTSYGPQHQVLCTAWTSRYIRCRKSDCSRDASSCAGQLLMSAAKQICMAGTLSSTLCCDSTALAQVPRLQAVCPHEYEHACLPACLPGALQVREEEIEAAHREQVQKRSLALLAAKANKFAAIHTERLKAFRQLSAAKVRRLHPCSKMKGSFDYTSMCAFSGRCCSWLHQ